jgi:D-beta-D-heptose 7-phosphate kinase/D-beta-D-heptose 1-phosphate adenosyltransferase
MDVSSLQQVLSAIHGLKIACIGDLMIDRYVYGDVARISPEAPIPVLARRSETVMMGAVGNVARNVAALSGEALLCAPVGDDASGQELAQLVAHEPGVSGCLVTQKGRPTTVKVRFVAGGQQLLRVDTEHAGAIDAEAEAALIQALKAAIKDAQLVVLSDYAKGALSSAVVAEAREAAARAGIALVVDPKGRSLAKYGPVDLIKPNAGELSQAVEMPVGTDAEVEAALAAALAVCEAKALLVTRAAQGMSLAVRGQPVRHFRGKTRQVFDVSGAGDTGLAALGLAMAAGVEMGAAVEFSILASGVVVGKAGTATVTPAELMEAELTSHMAPAEDKIATPEELALTVARWRAEGLTVGFTNGCFDILHRGHVAYLAQARSWCDRLIVGLNTDRSVSALKGPSRPVNDLESRALVLAGLSHVDMVVPFDEDTPMALIEVARPDVLIKGADYSEDGVVGGDFVKTYGGRVRLAALVDGYSTTAAIARFKKDAP